MIRESSIALAEPIAVAGFDIKPSSIIEGLNGETCGLGEFTENFRSEIVEVTSSEDIGHTDYMKEGSQRMAEILRTTLANIGDYGKPLAIAIAKGAENCYSRGELKFLAQSEFEHRFVHLDDPFLDSPLFPTEVKETGFNFTNVNLDMVKELTFEAPSFDDMVSFIGTGHADVVEAMKERDYTMNEAMWAIGNLENLGSTFVKGPNGNFDFSKIKSTDCEKLVKMYLLLTKMYASDDIPSWFKNGELVKYRHYIKLLWNGMTLYLIKLRQHINALRERKIILTEKNPVHLTDIRGDAKARVMKGEVTCFFTDAALETIVGADCAMSEVLVGYYWERMQGRQHPVAEILSDPCKFQNAAGAYYSYVHEKLMAHAKDRFVESSLLVMEKFILGNELVLERVKQHNQMVGTWIRSRFLGELERAYYNINAKHPNLGGLTVEGEASCSMEEAIMGTHIIPVFLREIGCTMAADILEDTYVCQATEDNIDDKKGRLTVAVINLLARKCFK